MSIYVHTYIHIYTQLSLLAILGGPNRDSTAIHSQIVFTKLVGKKLVPVNKSQVTYIPIYDGTFRLGNKCTRVEKRTTSVGINDVTA